MLNGQILILKLGIRVLPAERMTMRKPFIFHHPTGAASSRNAEKIIKTDAFYIFPGQGNGVMHGNALRNLLYKLGYAGITRHSFRSTFRDWANECTHYPREVCALANDERDQSEAVYSRSDLLENAGH